MSDLALVWNPALNRADLDFGKDVNGGTDLPSFTIPDSNDFLPEDGLNTAVLLSLFTNRRALPGDVLPVAGMDQQGWWGDTQSPLLNEQIGSRLWLLARSKTTPEVLTKAEDIAREALQWLIDDKVASTVDVTAAQGGTSLIPVLALTVAIHKPEGTAATFKYNLQWTAQKGEG